MPIYMLGHALVQVAGRTAGRECPEDTPLHSLPQHKTGQRKPYRGKATKKEKRQRKELLV
jgi:hypothetical protein